MITGLKLRWMALGVIVCLLATAARPLHAEMPMEAAEMTAASPSSEPHLAFPVLSDIHIQAWHVPSHTKLKAALNDLYAISPHADTLVVNGDLTNGLPADYTKLKQILAESPHPQSVLYTIGNHEFYKAWVDKSGSWQPDSFPNGETDTASIQRFLQFTGRASVYYEQQIKGYTLIMLGSEQYRQSDLANLEDAYLSETQLAWLKTTLAARSGDKKPIFVFLHQPLPNTVSGTSFCCVNNRGVVQHDVLKSILADYPQVILFTGHTHWELKLPGTLVRDGFTMVNTSSVEQPWTDDLAGGEKELDPAASEGLYVEVFEDKVLIRGRDFHAKQWIPEANFSIPIEYLSDAAR